MRRAIATGPITALVLMIAIAGFVTLLTLVGKSVAAFAQEELLANPRFAQTEANGPPEYWIQASDDAGATTLTQTVRTPFRGVRGNWRIVSKLRLAEPNTRVTYAIEGRTHNQWEQLDRRDTGGNHATKLVLEPRPLSPITDPPSELRVVITIHAQDIPPDLLQSASLRAGHAGLFNSLNPPNRVDLAVIFTGVTLAAFGAAWVLARRWRAPSPLRTTVVNSGLMAVSLTYLLLALEVATRTLLVFPDSMATTRVSELWWARHWTPLNESGYRDVSHPPNPASTRKVLFVVGDSFAAGHGIARFDDIFHQRLAHRLGDSWDVIVLAKPGLSTRDELAALTAQPIQPDAILVAHVWNDVNSALTAHGIAIPGKPAMVPWLRPIVLRSYFLDYVYWRVHGLRAPMRSYLDLILSAYQDETLWATHAADLAGFMEYARRANAPLLVAAFPALENIEASRITSARVTEYFTAHDVPAIDFGEIFAVDDPRAITVNAFDSHPNEAAHARIADVLYPLLEDALQGSTAP